MQDKEFTFFYPIVTVPDQDAFRDDGTMYTKTIATEGEGHILYQGRLMCGEIMGVLKVRVGAKNHSIKKQRVPEKKLCQVCQEKYKANQSSAWVQWERGDAIKEGGVVRFWDSAKNG